MDLPTCLERTSRIATATLQPAMQPATSTRSDGDHSCMAGKAGCIFWGLSSSPWGFTPIAGMVFVGKFHCSMDEKTGGSPRNGQLQMWFRFTPCVGDGKSHVPPVFIHERVNCQQDVER